LSFSCFPFPLKRHFWIGHFDSFFFASLRFFCSGALRCVRLFDSVLRCSDHFLRFFLPQVRVQTVLPTPLPVSSPPFCLVRFFPGLFSVRLLAPSSSQVPFHSPFVWGHDLTMPLFFFSLFGEPSAFLRLFLSFASFPRSLRRV